MSIKDKLKSVFFVSSEQAAPVSTYVDHEELYRQNRIAAFREELAKLRPIEIKLSDEKHTRNKVLEFIEPTPKNITKSTNLAKLRDFIALDTETTGLKTGGNDIIEVSAIHFHYFKQAELFTTLLRPRNPIPPDATAVNGITDEMVQNAPTFSEIVPALTEFIGNMPIVAHNAVFDLKHLYVNGLDAVEDLKYVYDTLPLSRKFCGKDILDHKLATVAREYNIVIDGAHRATADALACGLIFVQMLIQSRTDCYNIADLIKNSQ